MPLHRKIAPTYAGGLPATHDYINNPSANGDAGAPASVDGKKSSGTNAGTYLVAFGEPATSSNTNRAANALAENTDYLDDMVHRDLAEPIISSTATPLAPLASFTITGSVYVGDAGTPNEERVRIGLVTMLDTAGKPLVVSGTAVKATLIHDGANNSVIGQVFRTNPVVNISPSIPAGTAYRYAYYQRSNLTNISPGAFTRLSNALTALVDLSVGTTTGGGGTSGSLLSSDNTWSGQQVYAKAAANSELATIASTVQPGSTYPRNLQFSFPTSTDGKFARVYNSNSTTFQGLEFTINARWSGGSWIKDVNSAVSFRFRIGTNVSDGSSHATFATVAGGSASFIDATWDAVSTSVANGFAQYGAVASNTTPFITQGTSLTDGAFASHYLQILRSVTGTGKHGPHLYTTARGTGTGDDRTGWHLAVNCWWDHSVQLWRSENSGAGVFLVSVQTTGLYLRTLTAGAIPASWNDTAWIARGISINSGTLVATSRQVTEDLPILSYGSEADVSSGGNSPARWGIVRDGNIPFLQCDNSSYVLYIPIRLRYQSVTNTINQVTAIYSKYAAGSQAAFALARVETPGSGTVTPALSVLTTFSTSGSTTGIQAYNSATVSVPDTGATYLIINATSNLDRLYGVRVTYTTGSLN